MAYTAGCSNLKKPDFNRSSCEEVSRILVRSASVEDILIPNAEFQVNSINSVGAPDSPKEDQGKIRAQRNTKNIVQDKSDDEEGGMGWNVLTLPTLSQLIALVKKQQKAEQKVHSLRIAKAPSSDLAKNINV